MFWFKAWSLSRPAAIDRLNGFQVDESDARKITVELAKKELEGPRGGGERAPSSRSDFLRPPAVMVPSLWRVTHVSECDGCSPQAWWCLPSWRWCHF